MLKTTLGRCIFQGPGGARVYQNFLYRWLRFDSKAIQSAIDRKHPEKPVLKYLTPLCALARANPGDTCILGLGGAGAAHYLSQYIDNYKLISVDNNAEVIYIADKYFMANSIPSLDIVYQDALDFLKNYELSFKHLLVDLYHSNQFPEECNNALFFKRCDERLKDKGFLGVNLAAPEEQFIIFSKIKNQFNGCTVTIPVPASSNMVIFTCKNRSLPFLVEQLSKSLNIKKLIWDADWGCLAEITPIKTS